MELCSLKAAREFDDGKGIEDWFYRNPEKLVSYVMSAMKDGRSVPGVHLSQLATEVRIPLEYEGEKALVPPTVWVSPNTFSNIKNIILVGQTMR